MSDVIGAASVVLSLASLAVVSYVSGRIVGYERGREDGHAVGFIDALEYDNDSLDKMRKCLLGRKEEDE